jgi:hypothetical protein
MRIRLIILGLAGTMLAGCGGGASAPSGEGAADAVASAPAPVTCKSLPDFVAIADGATISLCTQGDTSGTSSATKRTSGTVIFTVPKAPDAVLAWYRDKAKQAGMADGLVTSSSYSARAVHRNVMVMVQAEGSGTQVTLNWGVDGAP